MPRIMNESFVEQARISRIPGRILLAPMAGFTDRAFREMCVAFGADFACTEMVSAEALSRGNDRTADLLERADGEQVYSVQIFAASPESAARAVRKIVPFRPALIDLNCGCPVPKIIKSGAGCDLMRDPERVRRILSAMLDQTDLPVTAKVRSGWEAGNLNDLEVAQAAAGAGAAMVCLHPRTRSQGYSGSADWSRITQLAAALDIPVFGSGDLWTGEDAVRMITETRCAGVMIARGAVGNPFVFEEAKRRLAGEPPREISPAERMETALRHLDLAVRYSGEQRACKEMRKHLCAYTRGLPGGAAVRERIVHASTREEYLRILEPFLHSLR